MTKKEARKVLKIKKQLDLTKYHVDEFCDPELYLMHPEKREAFCAFRDEFSLLIQAFDKNMEGAIEIMRFSK